MDLALVLFDVGETLLSPKPSWAHHFVDVCATREIEVPEDEVAEIFARELARFGARVAHSDARAFSLDESLSRQFWYHLYREILEELGVEGAEPLPAEIYRRFTRFDTYGLMDGANAVVGEVVRRGLVAGVVSNWEGWLPGLLAHVGLAERLGVVTVSGLVGVEKPDPAIYEIALAEAGVEASQALMVGDSLESDVLGPARVGIRGVLLDRHDRHPDVDVPRIRSLSELPPLLDRGLRE